MKKVLKEGDGFNTEEFADHILEKLRDWAQIDDSQSFDDDITYIVLDIK